MRLPRRLLGILLLGAVWNGARAVDAPPCPVPEYKYLRYDEDYRYLARPECKKEALDSIKLVPFPRGGDWFVSFGGELRWTIESFDEPQWGAQPDEDPYLLQRYMAHADLQDNTAALADLELARKQAPLGAFALGLRGRSLHALGRDKEAVEAFGEALRKRPNDSDILIDRAEALGESGKAEAGLKDIDAALKAQPATPTADDAPGSA